jgi:hypothetical protein
MSDARAGWDGPGRRRRGRARLVGNCGRPPGEWCAAATGEWRPPARDGRGRRRPTRAPRVKIAADPPRRGTRLAARRDGWPRREAHLRGPTRRRSDQGVLGAIQPGELSPRSRRPQRPPATRTPPAPRKESRGEGGRPRPKATRMCSPRGEIRARRPRVPCPGRGGARDERPPGASRAAVTPLRQAPGAPRRAPPPQRHNRGPRAGAAPRRMRRPVAATTRSPGREDKRRGDEAAPGAGSTEGRHPLRRPPPWITLVSCSAGPFS